MTAEQTKTAEAPKEQRKKKTLEYRLVESQLLPSSTRDDVHSVHQAEVGDFIFKVAARLEGGKVTISWPWSEARWVARFRANQRKTEARLEPLQTAIERELGAEIVAKTKELNDLLDA